MYCGNSVQNKRSRISYKNRKLRPNSKPEWNIVENTHEPIIDKKIFETVQKMQIAKSYSRNEKKHHFLLDGLLICYECKHKIGVRVTRNGGLDMVCNNYRRNSKLGLCTSHGFNYNKLEEQVLKYIKELFQKINKGKIELDIESNITKYDYGKMLQKYETEIKLINDNLDMMYVDKLNNKISEEMYNRVFNKMLDNIKQKEKEYNKLKYLKENDSQDDNEEIKRTVKDFLQLEKPTAKIMNVLINRIEVHQDKQIDIYFNFQRLNEISKTTV